MKKLLIVFLGLTTFLSCDQGADIIGQMPLDSVAPGIISNINVENGSGKAKVTYTLPADDDLSYVKATYKVNDKVTRTAIASYYNNELLLEGFGEVKPYTVTLVTVDKSRNESAPVEVVVNPELAPVHVARQSIIVENDFGGIFLRWLNPEEKNLNIEVDVNDLNNPGFFVQNTVFYSADAVGTANVRGFAPVTRTFRITIVDRWGNRSEPLEIERTPVEEIMIPLGITLPTINFPLNPGGGGGIALIYDGIVGNNGLVSNIGMPARPQLTIDFGQKVKLSRMIIWQKVLPANLRYADVNPKTFAIYGSNTPPPTQYPDNDYTNWTLIQTGEVIKPSGLPSGQVSTEDSQQATAGHSTNFSSETPAYRYFRYELLTNWTPGNKRVMIGEMQVFGNYIN